MRPTALVRQVPQSFASSITLVPADPPLSADLARRQHDEYRARLEEGGFEVVVVPADDGFPDCAFVEDPAVVFGDRALITIPGHPTRQGEGPPIAEALGSLVEVEWMSQGTLDGGDVLPVGGRIMVGISTRTDAAGCSELVRFAPVEVAAVPVVGTLHLTSGVSRVDDDTVLWHPAACDRSHLDGLRVLPVGGDDPAAANVVPLPDGSVLAAAHHVGTVELLDREGYRVVTTDITEFARADGALTCLSLRIV